MVRLQIARSDEQSRSAAAEHIKRVALRLFAERGVDGVTVREIAAAAGQKNHGAVGYYFGSKEALVRVIIMDGAVELEQLRNAALDRLEAEGGPRSVREIVDVLILPVTALGDRYYIRFVTLFSMSHRDLMLDAIDPRWNRAYGRCLDHLRRLMPQLSPGLQNQRFIFMGACLGAVLSARERALADESRDHPMWGSEHGLEHFAQALTALLEAPVDLPAAAIAQIEGRAAPLPETRGPVG
ncbi:TetR/AcrR family transcriptional regulator [Flavisphingomonas formosensis]|uniref:TetR/AcrR family transcriptional regulator n=1 Tax=Flavisphingomonas formosensis TaxID=861534 RepID=UPI0012F967E8|nr:TetR/AcrR family transcriptional regulator [Sphingomonas formosensis]